MKIIKSRRSNRVHSRKSQFIDQHLKRLTACEIDAGARAADPCALRWSCNFYVACLVNLRLLLDLSHRPNVRDPWLRGAMPNFHIRGDLVALTNGTDSNGVNLGSCPNRRRINWRSTFRAERLWPFIPALAGLDVSFQFAREQPESTFPSIRDHAKRGAR